MQAAGNCTSTCVMYVVTQLDLYGSRGSNTLTFTAHIKMQLVFELLRILRRSLSLLQAARGNASTSAAYMETQLDLDARRESKTLAIIACIKMQLVFDASRRE